MSARTALVTGAGSGIGREIAAALARGGSHVIGVDRIAIDAHPDFAETIVCDVTSDAEIAAMAARVDRLDVLVNNAGIPGTMPFADADIARWTAVFDVNLFGMVRVTRALLPRLREGEHPAIVNLCSTTATIGLAERTVYSASKGAILSFSTALAAELLTDGIRVNCVSPGVVDTPWQAAQIAAAADPEAFAARMRSLNPIGRLVSSTEVAEAVVYLASTHTTSTTGINLPVDGGMLSLRRRDGEPS